VKKLFTVFGSFFCLVSRHKSSPISGDGDVFLLIVWQRTVSDGTILSYNALMTAALCCFRAGLNHNWMFF